MAIRLYVCPFCGKETEELYWGVYPKEIPCECGKKARNRLAAPGAIFMNWRPGYDVGLDRTFETKRERDNYLARHNMSEDRGSSGHGSRSEPEAKSQRTAFLAAQEAKNRK